MRDCPGWNVNLLPSLSRRDVCYNHRQVISSSPEVRVCTHVFFWLCFSRKFKFSRDGLCTHQSPLCLQHLARGLIVSPSHGSWPKIFETPSTTAYVRPMCHWTLYFFFVALTFDYLLFSLQISVWGHWDRKSSYHLIMPVSELELADHGLKPRAKIHPPLSCRCQVLTVPVTRKWQRQRSLC